MNDIQGYDASMHARTRSRLTKLELNVAALPDIPQKKILFNEIERAKVALEANDTTYSEALWGDIRGNIRRIKWYYRIFPNQFDSNIVLWLKGLILYSSIVLLIFGPCAVIVHIWPSEESTSASLPLIVVAIKYLGLDPLFTTVKDLGIKSKAYLWGLLGGAGAVVSMVKRIKSIETQKVSHWLLFTQGLFNPIVGSLSAVVACAYYSNTLKEEVTQIPLYVVAFFAGFSERILASIGTQANGPKKAS